MAPMLTIDKNRIGESVASFANVGNSRLHGHLRVASNIETDSTTHLDHIDKAMAARQVGYSKTLAITICFCCAVSNNQCESVSQHLLDILLCGPLVWMWQ